MAAGTYWEQSSFLHCPHSFLTNLCKSVQLETLKSALDWWQHGVPYGPVLFLLLVLRVRVVEVKPQTGMKFGPHAKPLSLLMLGYTCGALALTKPLPFPCNATKCLLIFLGNLVLSVWECRSFCCSKSSRICWVCSIGLAFSYFAFHYLSLFHHAACCMRSKCHTSIQVPRCHRVFEVTMSICTLYICWPLLNNLRFDYSDYSSIKCILYSYTMLYISHTHTHITSYYIILYIYIYL